jgi:hypothetical protein
MADDELLDAPNPESAEDIERRPDEFFGRLGIHNFQFPNLFEDAVIHATAPRPAAGAPPAHNWFPVGPRNVGGRIIELVQDSTNASTLYAGTAFGGVWRTRNGGDTWEHLAEVGNPPESGAQSYAVGAMAVPFQNPEVLYVGTGDPFDGYGSGRGLWKATIAELPAGVVFRPLVAPDPPTTLPANATPGAAPRYTRIQVDPDEPTRFWAASPHGVFQCDVPIPVGSPAVFKRVFPAVGTAPAVPGSPPLPAATGTPYATDVLVARDPRDAARIGGAARYLILYVAISRVGVFRGRFDRTAGATGTITWDPVLGIPIATAFGRIRLALCKNQPRFVYAIFEDLASAPVSRPTVVYRSEDNGDTWVAGANPQPVANHYAALKGNANHALALTVHPERPEIIVSGTVDLNLSENSGDGWTTIMDWTNYDNGDHAQHADQHSVLFDLLDPHKIWVGNDGGLSLGLDIRRPALSPGYWRKRSHGILAAQFQDVTADSTLPFRCGGGLQDNGTYIGFGGPSWFYFFGGDGGMTAFDPTSPRSYYLSTQSGILGATVVPATSPPTITQSRVVNDVPAPFNSMRVRPVLLSTSAHNVPAVMVGGVDVGPPFVGIVEHHPSAANTLMIGRVGGGFWSNDGGAHWHAITAPPIGAAAPAPIVLAAPPGEQVTALAFGPHSSGAVANIDGWLGTSLGQLFVTANAPGGNWRPVVVPWGAADPTPSISRIATNPNNANVVAICTIGPQGRVMLSYDHGVHWREITAPVPAAANQDLPRCPITSIVFDPGNPRDLYVGTLVGVYVLKNLPAQPAGGGLVPAFTIDWRPFNTGHPLTLVNDLTFIVIPGKRVLRAATFGRGMYDCAVAGAVQRQLYIRSTLVEDGHTYPRPNAHPVPDDLRVIAGTVPLDYVHSFDIRVDAPPYSFFEDTMDGVEFDEDLANDVAVPGETNLVYVQVHNSGFLAVPDVSVHLYFRASPAVAFGAPVPALGTPADFWHPPNFDVSGAGTTWVRVGQAQVLSGVGPCRPAVARFEWVPPVGLAGGSAALLALCSGPFAPIAIDTLPAAAPAGTIPALITAERRAALRVVAVGPFVPDVFIRHGADDHGVPGVVPFGGRSPDIMVVQDPVGAPPDVRHLFRDLNSPRLGDRLRGGTNFIFVRVHNRKNVDVNVDVELFWAKPNVARAAAETNTPPFDNTQWGHVTPTSTAVNQTIPARDWGVVQLQWDNPPDPDTTADNPYRAFLLIALIKTSDNLDPAPLRTRVATLREFWTTFQNAADTNNAAIRAIRYEP